MSKDSFNFKIDNDNERALEIQGSYDNQSLQHPTVLCYVDTLTTSWNGYEHWGVVSQASK